ncbi:hypothetical protein D0T49_12280 [Paludibacter sp. 221]|uniref:hypothetical protein n=1 Tax=Paludibacter sp. 221 TaxID=2302939 RepID=UPI0013D674EB|nr:hypothetical protein [Paludibacter sp. 221]NDV47824.1 hypothetical protein [Paludibacter sp. 221]
MTNYINSLLDKYFEGETTIPEERLLKDYFSSDEVKSEHEKYRPLFCGFIDETKAHMNPEKISFTNPKENKKEKNNKSNKQGKALSKRFIIYPAVAAAVILFFVLILPKESENSYVKIHGKKIKNTEYVEQYTHAKLKKVNVLLSGSLNSLENITKARRGVEMGIEAVGSIRETIDIIYENLPIKIIRNEENNDLSSLPHIGGSNSKRTNA